MVGSLNSEFGRMAHSVRADATPAPVTGLKHGPEEKLYEDSNPYIFTICSAYGRSPMAETL
jgi:hypothetical protein